MNYLLFLFWIFFMILFHYLIKNDFSFIQKYLNKLFKYSPLFKEYLKKYLKTILYTFFTFIVGKTFEHLDMWVDLFFVSIWMLVDEKENINIENKKETIPSLIGIVLGLLLQYFIWFYFYTLDIFIFLYLMFLHSKYIFYFLW